MTALALTDRRPVALGGSAMAHLVVAVGLVVIPAGVATRLNRPIEASIAPMPQSVPVEVQTGATAADAPLVDAEPIEMLAPAGEPQEAIEQAIEQAIAPTSELTEMVAPEPVVATPPEPEAVAALGEAATAFRKKMRENKGVEQQSDSAEADFALAPKASAMVPPPDVLASSAGDDATPASDLAPETVATIAPATSDSVPATAPRRVEPPPPEPAKILQSQVKPTRVEPTRVKPPRLAPAEVEPARVRPVRRAPTVRDLAQSGSRKQPDPRKAARSSPAGATGAPSDIGGSTTARSAGATRTDYAALVLAAIRSRVRYPAQARARGREGVAMVSFAVGPAGRVGAASLARGTGDPSLDGAAVALVRALSLPPPPGGSFRATVPIRYRLTF